MTISASINQAPVYSQFILGPVATRSYLVMRKAVHILTGSSLQSMCSMSVQRARAWGIAIGSGRDSFQSKHEGRVSSRRLRSVLPESSSRMAEDRYKVDFESKKDL